MASFGPGALTCAGLFGGLGQERAEGHPGALGSAREALWGRLGGAGLPRISGFPNDLVFKKLHRFSAAQLGSFGAGAPGRRRLSRTPAARCLGRAMPACQRAASFSSAWRTHRSPLFSSIATKPAVIGRRGLIPLLFLRYRPPASMPPLPRARILSGLYFVYRFDRIYRRTLAETDGL